MPFRALRFADPQAASWLLVLPLVWGGWLLQRWYRDRQRHRSGIGPRAARLAPISGRARDLMVLAVATLGGMALVTAAARPQAVVRIPQYEPFDLIVLLDRSASMLATDIQPSRLSRACLEIQKFLESKPEPIDRIALIPFAGTPIVTAHLTQDVEILFFFLDWLLQDRTPVYGTDFGAALDSALAVARTEKPDRRKVIVMLSDGDDHSERLDRAIEDVRESGIPVYAVGIGGEAGVTIPAPAGSFSPTLRDDDGNELVTKFAEGTLQRIARTTGGGYFRSATGPDLATVLSQVTLRARRPVASRDEYRDVDSMAFAAAAFCLSALLVLR